MRHLLRSHALLAAVTALSAGSAFGATPASAAWRDVPGVTAEQSTKLVWDGLLQITRDPATSNPEVEHVGIDGTVTPVPDGDVTLGWNDDVGGIALPETDYAADTSRLLLRPAGAEAFGSPVALGERVPVGQSAVFGDLRGAFALLARTKPFSSQVSSLWIARRTAADAPMQIVRLSTEDMTGGVLGVAGGRLLLVWQRGSEYSSTGTALYAQVITSAGDVGPAHQLTPPGAAVGDFRVIGHADGSAHVAWSEIDTTVTGVGLLADAGAVRLATLAAGASAPSAPLTLPGAERRSALHGLAALPGVGAAVGWSRAGDVDPRTAVAVTEVTAAGALSPPLPIAGHAHADGPSLSPSPDGHLEASWIVPAGSAALGESAHRTPDGRWHGPAGINGCVRRFATPRVLASFGGLSLATPGAVSDLAVSDGTPGGRCATSFRSDLPWAETARPPADAALPPASAAAPGPAPAPAKLRLVGSRVEDGVLSARVQVTSRAEGRITFAYRAAGRTSRFSAAVPDHAEGAPVAFTVRERLPSAQRRIGTGILTVAFDGSPGVREDELRLRVAPHKSDLRRRRAEIDEEGRLRVEGTVARRASGVVRVRVGYVDAAGRVAFARHTAKIRRRSGGRASRWTLSAPFPEGVAVAQLSIQYTGDLDRRVRGEATAKQVTR